MSPTLDDMIRARVPAATAVYYWRVKHKRNAWRLTRDWLGREFRGAEPKVLDQVIIFARAGVKAARNLNRTK